MKGRGSTLQHSEKDMYLNIMYFELRTVSKE